MNRKRNPNIELLRIICMLMIISMHYVIQAGVSEIGYQEIGSGVVFEQMLSMFGRSACSVFALITGYYSIRKQISIPDQVKKGILYTSKVCIYSWIIFALSSILCPGFLDKNSILSSIIPFYKENWFITYYIVFSLFIPVFNILFNSISLSLYKRICILAFIVWSIIPTVTMNMIEYSNFDFFIFFYLVGGYIRISKLDTRMGNIKWRMITIISVVILFCSVGCFDVLGVVLKKDILVNSATWFRNYNTIPSVVFAISIFCLMTTAKIKWGGQNL